MRWFGQTGRDHQIELGQMQIGSGTTILLFVDFFVTKYHPPALFPFFLGFLARTAARAAVWHQPRSRTPPARDRGSESRSYCHAARPVSESLVTCLQCSNFMNNLLQSGVLLPYRFYLPLKRCYLRLR